MTSARDLRLLHRLQLAAHAAKKTADVRMTEATGLTTAQMAVLTVLADVGPASQRDVARVLGVNESAVTSMVRRLETAGHVTRGVDPADRRVRSLALTADGRRALAAGRTAFRPVNEIFDRTLTAAEAATLADLLSRLTTAFWTDMTEEDR